MSDCVVQKYGGSSVATAERIKAVAARVSAQRQACPRVVVIVSAMGDTTDELIALARGVCEEPSARELDLLLSTGELVSCTLLAMALRHRGCEAVALTGAQAGIRTDASHSRARIVAVEPRRVLRELERGRVVIVAGFQGVTDEMDVTTLGRGGSDTTAVALAAALEAGCCEIYTDVEGVFTADPRVVPEARKLDEICYEEMLELAQQGARVMHPRAVELGELYQLPILVRSSFHERPGTLIHGAVNVEYRNKVRGIAHDSDVAKISVMRVPDRPGVAFRLFSPLAEAGINVDTIVQNTGHDGYTDLSFTVSRNDFRRAVEIVRPGAQEVGAEDVLTDHDLGKVSIVGTGIQHAPGYAARMFGALADHGINIEMITTSDIRITCVVRRDQIEGAVRALHRAFALEKRERPLG